MMTWNYRIMKRKDEIGEYEFGIYEVYYDENGNVSCWTEKSLIPTNTTAEDLFQDMTIMMEAFKKSTLNYDKDEINERTI